MDHIRLLKEIIDYKNLELAFRYALYDRTNNDYYYDYFEIDYVVKNKNKIICQLIDELKNIEKYTLRTAYAFYPPKNNLCFRRMVYIPFKDLLVRYAVIIVFSKYLDNKFYEYCFANRITKCNQYKISLFENFSQTSWPKFCSWQKENTKKYKILLRTDISAFYDSISHKELINKVSEELSVEIDSDLIRLFKKLLEVPVISYSNLDRTVKDPKKIAQGIPTGNNTEGFLANLYLKNIDESMQSLNNIEFGRYNDDMRIFGNSRQEVLKALLILQEKLLSIGLNLNSSKTEIAENEAELENLRSKIIDISSDPYFEEYNTGEIISTLSKHIDKNFDEFDQTFKPNDLIDSNINAKNYCKFLSHTDKYGRKLLNNSDRSPEHVEKLEEIIIKWQGSSKHASWLIIESAFYSGIPKTTKKSALEIIFRLLQSDYVNPYAKYKLINHILKQRTKNADNKYRFLDLLDENFKNKLIEIAPILVNTPAFEINIAVLYLLKVLGKSNDEIKYYINKYAIKPLGEPLNNILLYISEEPK